MDFTRHFNPRRTDQLQPIPGREQDMVQNPEGGFTFEADSKQRLRRFLILGTEGGQYYASEREHTYENCASAHKLITNGEGPWVVDQVRDVMCGGKAHKPYAALFVLSMCIAFGDKETRKHAHVVFPQAARTHDMRAYVFNTLKQLTGKVSAGRGMRRAVGKCYLDKPLRQLIYAMTKYPVRRGWSQRDVLRVFHTIDERGRLPVIVGKEHLEVHPDYSDLSNTTERGLIMRLGANIEPLVPEGSTEGRAVSDDFHEALRYYSVVLMARSSRSVSWVARLIDTERLPHEVIPDRFKDTSNPANTVIWEALLNHMPIRATVRQLTAMGMVGLLKPFSGAEDLVCRRLADRETIKRARMHPFNFLIAKLRYSTGGSQHGTWTPSQRILEALDAAFYLAYDAMEPTNRRTLLALDVSGSMSANTVQGLGIPGFTPRHAAAALALATLNAEPNCYVMGFTTRPYELDITRRDSLESVIRKLDRISIGEGTSCQIPVLWADSLGMTIDDFVLYSDNISFYDSPHPSQAFLHYRQKNNPNAKFVDVAMVANNAALADPREPDSMLDVVGLATDTPSVIAEFCRG